MIVGTGGIASPSGANALLWRDATAASAINLHQLLPPGFSLSIPDSIDQQSRVFGRALDAGGAWHAVMWVPVPEPTALMLGLFCLAARGAQR